MRDARAHAAAGARTSARCTRDSRNHLRAAGSRYLERDARAHAAAGARTSARCTRDSRNHLRAAGSRYLEIDKIAGTARRRGPNNAHGSGRGPPARNACGTAFSALRKHFGGLRASASEARPPREN
ncbi:hypothetical protein AQ782_17340 [Burkholderia pseudomallei]|nr:hypothetical protein ACT79_24520 [Burkholderia pseudomallei]OMU10781.1 hypothetical protein AQ770_12540 [Burkholderia pseudomallei]OMU87830.1 hypothetical protein AQ782_17340 [Burkholderia pseudomallei]